MWVLPIFENDNVTLFGLTPQKGQTHSNNSATADKLFGVFDHFVGLALKGLNLHQTLSF